MKLIKKMILAAVVVLLASSCEMFTPDTGSVNFALSNGENISQVIVNIGGNARTLLPASGFSKYIISAIPDKANTASAPANVEVINEKTGRIGLLYGDWLLTVSAMVTVNGTDYVAAASTVPVAVNNNFNSVDVNLYAPSSGGKGIFKYSVVSPLSVTANTITLSALGETSSVVFTKTMALDFSGSEEISSGIYFLTVKAAGSKTLIRNEIVHIYNKMTTEADYVFSSIDFGASSLKIGGTINLLINGKQPSLESEISIKIKYGDNINDYIPLKYTGTNGNAQWEYEFTNLHGANKIYFSIEFLNDIIEIPPIAVPLENKLNILLGNYNIELKTIMLTPEKWFNGNLSNKISYAVYSIDVTAGQTYYLWWNDRNAGDGTKTCDIGILSAYEDLTTLVLADRDNAWDIPAAFVAEKTSTVYLIAAAFGDYDAGSFAIAYSTNINWHNNNFNSSSAISLSENVWLSGEITEQGEEFLYSMDVKNGQKYYIFWSDLNNGFDTLDIIVNALGENLTGIKLTDKWDVIENDRAWYSPVSFTASLTGKVFLKVKARNIYNNGTYNIVYNQSGNRPVLAPSNVTPISKDLWIDDSIAPNIIKWYSISVEPNQDYYFWWDDIYSCTQSGTVDIYVTIYNENGEELFQADNILNYAPWSVHSNDLSIFYIKVYSATSGTYSFAYSTLFDWFSVLDIAVKMNPDVWIDGIIHSTNSDNQYWYYLEVTSGTTYNFWLNDLYDGDGSKTANVSFGIYPYEYNYLSYYFNNDNAWNKPVNFTVWYDGYLIIRVFPDSTGTYGIKYVVIDD